MPMLYGPLETCPQCKQPASFGRCMVTAHGLTFRCQRCPHFTLEPLPPITKKVIYIDQFALSKMVKPMTDSFWSELHRQLLNLASNELIVCPYSPMHKDESLLSVSLRDALKGMYRTIAGSVRFNRPFNIEKAQLTRQLKQFLGKTEPEDHLPSWKDWTDENPHRWSDLFSVHVDFDIDEDSVREMRAEKEHFRNGMVGQCEEWTKNPQTFNEDVEANYTSWRTTLLKSRLEIVTWLVEWVRLLNKDEANPIGVVNQFFLSEVWKQAPFAYLWVRLWAKIAEMARSPRGGRKPQLGDYFDAQVLTYYAPYCDAIFIDRGYRAIACDPRVNVEGRFGTKCFSEQNRDEFMDYLNEIAKSMSQSHKDTLRYVHPAEELVS